MWTVNGTEKIARQEIVRNSLKDLEHDPLGQKICMRLEPSPIIYSILYKEKGLVFNFQLNSRMKQFDENIKAPKLMAGDIRATNAMTITPFQDFTQTVVDAYADSASSGGPPEGSTGFRVGSYDSNPSRTKMSKSKPRRRQRKF